MILWGSVYRPFKQVGTTGYELTLQVLAPVCSFLLQLQRLSLSSLNSFPLAPYTQNGGSVPRLGVNIDHVATLRQARGGTDPDPLAAAVLVELAGRCPVIPKGRDTEPHRITR